MSAGELTRTELAAIYRRLQPGVRFRDDPGICPFCRRPIGSDPWIPAHTDLRTGGRSMCPASGQMSEHDQAMGDPPERWFRDVLIKQIRVVLDER